MHVLAGLPRSGSTLLANTLSQHDEIYVSGTSSLFPSVNALSASLTSSAEVKAMMTNVPDTYQRLLHATRAFTDAWYSHRQETAVMDKGRGWLSNPALLRQLYPDAQIIVTVRDPRDVIASMFRKDQATALFQSPIAPTLYAMTDQAMAPTGLVGSAIKLVEDAIRTKLDCMFVRYESFVVDPYPTLEHITKALGVDQFAYDCENVQNVAEDLDTLYNNKYPHDAQGAIGPSTTSWHDVMTDEMATLIYNVCPLFMQTFSYSME